ncbi:MAG: hypothetical protein PVG32_07815 [Anaerolineales bacterium]|jgi:DUF4097 and DUF4098 domain-containing protein YvlB
MATTEERLKILKLIQEGKITAEEGAKLLSALSASTKKKPRQTSKISSARRLRVRVTDLTSGKSKVNVNLPLKLVDAGLNIASQFAPDVELEGLMSAVDEAIGDNMMGKIVEVIDEDDQEHIEIFIE